LIDIEFSPNTRNTFNRAMHTNIISLSSSQSWCLLHRHTHTHTHAIVLLCEKYGSTHGGGGQSGGGRRRSRGRGGRGSSRSGPGAHSQSAQPPCLAPCQGPGTNSAHYSSCNLGPRDNLYVIPSSSQLTYSMSYDYIYLWSVCVVDGGFSSLTWPSKSLGGGWG